MGGYKIVNQHELHYLTMTVVGWIDVFTRKDYKDIIIESLKYCQKEKGLLLFAYVIMSNHLHLIVRAGGEQGLSSIVRDFKKYTSKTIIASIQHHPQESRRDWMMRMFKYYAKYNKRNKEYQFWQQDNHPIELISPKWINQKIDYIHFNPVQAGIVDKAEEYLYSSARNYRNREGLIEVEVLDIRDGIGYIYMG